MFANTKILLVDDDKDDQLFFTEALNEVNPQIDCGIANNGLEAIDHLHKIPPPPSIIFLDLNMPYMNGFECLCAIKNDHNYSNIPIVVLTTSNNLDDRKKSLEMGANMFVTKPADFSSLTTGIREILQQYLA